jgi:hypothetical protein
MAAAGTSNFHALFPSASFYLSLLLFQIPSWIFPPLLYPFAVDASSSSSLPALRLQGVAVRGRLLCGTTPLKGTKVKIVDLDASKKRNIFW